MMTSMMIMLVLLALLVVSLSGLAAALLLEKRKWKQLIEGDRQRFIGKMIGIYNDTTQAFEEMLSELRQTTLPLDASYQEWKMSCPLNDDLFDEIDLFLLNIPAFEDDMSWMTADLSIPGDTLWGDQL